MPFFRNQQGFTLIEAIIVLAIISIIATAATPSFMGLRDRIALRSAGEDFLTSLAEARMDATKQGSPLTLNLNTTVSHFPTNVVVFGTTTIGSSSSTPGQVVIEPSLGILQTPADAGKFEIGAGAYRMRFELSPVAQGRLCDPGTGLNSGVPAC